MDNFSFMEMADMHFIYGKANGNATLAQRLYAETFPDRVIPCNKTFSNLHRRLRENGSFQQRKQDCGRHRTIRTPEAEERVLDVVAENPGTSIRRISTQEGISKSSVWRIVHEQLLYPYHRQRVQALKPQDLPLRLNYCHWLREECRRDPHFLESILFTDEAGFTRDGILNYHNTHVWADENPHAFFEANHQEKFSINVWAGIIGDYLIGPYVLPNRLNGESYLHFLQNVLNDLMDDVPYLLRREMRFMHDGAPPHFSRAVREYLDNMYPERWIGRGGPVGWPPRSPDLNPLDFFLWGYLKSLVYEIPVQNEDELQQRVINACEHIRNIPQIFQRVRFNTRRRIRSCIEMNGGHFEHLL